MLNEQELMDLVHSLAAEHVLSVYVDGQVRDPALQARWRARIAAQLSAIRSHLSASDHREREAFESCVRHLDDAMSAISGAVGAPGWLAFITASGIRYAASQPVPLPDAVEWCRGARIARYLRVLKEETQVLVAVVDSRKAAVSRYRHGRLESLRQLHAHHPVGDVPHMGDAPRNRFHPGTRGRTGTEAAANAAAAGRKRLMHELGELMAEQAGSDGWVLIGGTPKAAMEGYAALPRSLDGRAVLSHGLGITASAHQIATAAAATGSALRRARDEELVGAVLERCGGHGKAVAGVLATREAMRAGAVHEVLLTSAFIDRQPDEAEDVVRAAMAQRARVALVSGNGATLLDTKAEGVGALLRFTATTPFGDSDEQGHVVEDPRHHVIHAVTDTDDSERDNG
jgi:hypothetical protein